MEPCNQKIKALLHERECPFDYQCRDVDCFVCMKLHMEEADHEAKNDDQ